MRFWPKGGLWRHPDFLKLWSAETISQVGSQVGGLALPFVAIVTLGVSPFEVALLGVFEFAPFILVSLPAGVWVDRLPRRPILIVGDLGRAALLATIPVAYAFDVLTIWQLYAVGFLFGVLTVFFDVAYQSYLPSLVSRDQLVDGNSKLEISRSGAQLAGPALAGVLVQALTAPVAMLIDAISFVASGAFVLRIRTRENAPARENGRSPFAGMKGGAVGGSPLCLRPPLPALDRRFDGDLQLLQQRDVRHLPRLRRAPARPVGRHDRLRLRHRQRRLPHRRDRRQPNCTEARRRAGDRSRCGSGHRSGAGAVGPRERPDSLPHRLAADRRLRARRSTTSRRSASGRRSRRSGCRAG